MHLSAHRNLQAVNGSQTGAPLCCRVSRTAFTGGGIEMITPKAGCYCKAEGIHRETLLSISTHVALGESSLGTAGMYSAAVHLACGLGRPLVSHTMWSPPPSSCPHP